VHRHDDARTLASAAQAHVRCWPSKPVRAGSRQTAAAKTYGVSLRAVNTWVAIDKVVGLRALKPKRRGRWFGQGGRLGVVQRQRIRSLIVGMMPNQLKLPFHLWTRAAVASLIARDEYGITVSLVTVGRYLLAWGLSPQKPVRRATSGMMPLSRGG
jgi:transposase